MSDETLTEAVDLDPLAAVEKRRAERKAALRIERDAQRVVDLERVDELEVEHGDESVKVVNIQWSKGMPTLCVVRCPTRPEMKRYQDRIRAKNANTVTAAEEVSACCVLYPNKDQLAALYENRPGLPVCREPEDAHDVEEQVLRKVERKQR